MKENAPTTASKGREKKATEQQNSQRYPSTPRPPNTTTSTCYWCKARIERGTLLCDPCMRYARAGSLIESAARLFRGSSV